VKGGVEVLCWNWEEDGDEDEDEGDDFGIKVDGS
jgi:hypothetical protein